MDGTLSASPERLTASDRLARSKAASLATSLASLLPARNWAILDTPAIASLLGLACVLLAAWINTQAAAGVVSVALGMILALALQVFARRVDDARTQDLQTVSPTFGVVDLQTKPAGPHRNAVSPAGPLAPHEQTEALAELTARISHDLRTPLNAVIGFSELMSRETFGPLGSSQYQEYAKHIRESGQSLLRSAEDTLAITSALARPDTPESAELGSISLGDLCSEAWERVSQQAEARGIDLQCELDCGLEVLGTRRSLRQAVVNLLLEALCQCHDNRSVVIQAATSAQNVVLSLRVADSRVVGGCADSLQISVARALLELHGTPIYLETRACGSWIARLELEHGAQQQRVAA